MPMQCGIIVGVTYGRSSFRKTLTSCGAGYESIRSIEAKQLRTDIPAIAVGDTVKVMVKVVEGKTERLQAFEGVVIAKRNGGIRETFTVRRVSYGIGVERTFPVHSPRLGSITIIRHGKVRRAKLYYLRSLQGRAAKIKEVKRV